METITLGVILKSRISMLLTASVDPNNGQYTWSSPDASVSFDNSSAGTVHVTATSYSGGISDTQVTLNYRYNNKNAQDQPSSPAEFERPASWQSWFLAATAGSWPSQGWRRSLPPSTQPCQEPIP